MPRDPFRIVQVDELQSAEKRLMGKLVLSTTEGAPKVGIVEAVGTQLDQLGFGSDQSLVMMIRSKGGELRSQWIIWPRIQIWGE